MVKYFTIIFIMNVLFSLDLSAEMKDVREVNRDIANKNCKITKRQSFMSMQSDNSRMIEALNNLSDEKKQAARNEIENHRKKMAEIMGDDLASYFKDEDILGIECN